MDLKGELIAEEGSFLLELRTGISWNHNSFINLLKEAHKEYQNTKNDSELNREIAEGIWYISHFIKEWSSHENFPKVHSNEYYSKAYDLIHDIAYEYFMGESVYTSEKIIIEKIEELNTLTKQ
ncbi:hypothetical protein [uncultured Dokdonia sp.]|uniref:hypothetical protein n=1 Tax=uncultured Dokdonia sp. TaxID=575653 RepID=UPI0026212A94|nr:hypothetical protein [uncultured Dokdonia sp.]